MKNISNFILKNINFKLKGGDILAIVGHNGCGKTTLLQTIIGFEKTNKDGNIFLNNKSIKNEKIYKRAKLGISYIMQDIPEYTGIKVINYIKGILKNKYNENIIHDWFENFGLNWNEYKFRFFDNHLSGGERKKIEIITTFLLDKEIYLFDEVENSLDIYSKKILNKLIVENQKKGKIFIIVSHNKEILNLSNKSILLCDGKIELKDNFQSILKKYNNICRNCQLNKETNNINNK